MLKLVRLSVSRLAAHPVRSALVVLTLALGTSVVAVAFSLRLSVGRLEDAALPENGSRVVIANGEADAAGVWEWEMPWRFAQADAAEIAAQYPAVTAISPWSRPGWQEVRAAGRRWKLRGSAGTGSEYAAIMGLEMIEGSFFTAEDVGAHEHVVVLSESAARTIFGDPASALGQELHADSGVMAVSRAGDGSAEPVPLADAYRVVGVFGDPPRLRRDAYGIPEAIIPHTAILPPGIPIELPLSAFVALVRETRLPVIQESVRQAMVSTYGDEVKVTVWEGSPESPLGKELDSARRTIRSFSLILGILSVAVLFMSSFGVFSSLMTEGADAGRETGIMRAVGARKGTIRLVVVTKAATLGLAGGIIGAAGALALAGAASGLLDVLLESVGIAGASGVARRIEPMALLSAVGSAVASASLFGMIPAALSARIPIVQAIKEA